MIAGREYLNLARQTTEPQLRTFLSQFLGDGNTFHSGNYACYYLIGAIIIKKSGGRDVLK
jgi:hypothetical protein